MGQKSHLEIFFKNRNETLLDTVPPNQKPAVTYLLQTEGVPVTGEHLGGAERRSTPGRPR